MSDKPTNDILKWYFLQLNRWTIKHYTEGPVLYLTPDEMADLQHRRWYSTGGDYMILPEESEWLKVIDEPSS